MLVTLLALLPQNEQIGVLMFFMLLPPVVFVDICYKKFKLISLCLVRDKGVEPIPLSGLDPKSSASASSANLAKYFKELIKLKHLKIKSQESFLFKYNAVTQFI